MSTTSSVKIYYGRGCSAISAGSVAANIWCATGTVAMSTNEANAGAEYACTNKKSGDFFRFEHDGCEHFNEETYNPICTLKDLVINFDCPNSFLDSLKGWIPSGRGSDTKVDSLFLTPKDYALTVDQLGMQLNSKIKFAYRECVAGSPPSDGGQNARPTTGGQ